MSLINQMLKDLEERKRSSPHFITELSGLSLSGDLESTSQKMKWIVAGGCLVFALTALLARHHFSTSSIISSDEHVQLTQVQSTKTIDSAEKQDTINQAASIPSVLAGITLEVEKNTTHLRFLLNQNTLYRVNEDPKRHVIYLILENTALVSDLPSLNYLKSGIKNIHMISLHNGDLKLILTLAEGATLQGLNISADNQSPELQLDLLNPSPEVIPESLFQPDTKKTTFIKKPITVFNLEQTYDQAMDALNSGKKEEGMHSLNLILTEHPDFALARESLVSSLLEAGHKARAYQLLQPGLLKQPDYLPFRELQARLLVSEGKIDEALEFLQKSAPAIESNPQYHAFIAALYERRGYSELAAHLYKQLLILQPSNGIWWMGLGISLENMGKEAEAKEAYLRADNTSGLNPELKAFVESRIQ